MREPLQVLLVEDSEDDFELLLRELRRGPYDVRHRRVETADAFRAALQDGGWDLVISDFSLPAFGARQALAILQESGKDVPFVIVSGTISEEIAVEALKAGAHDFMLKDRLARLLPAVEREVRDARERARHRSAELERKRVEAQLLVADRMVAMGSLAAGVAHEINNPLAALIANLELAARDLQGLVAGKEDPEATQRMREELADALVAAQRVRNIVRDLKIFSRGDDEQKTHVDACRVMDSTLRMASNEIKHRAQLVKRLDPVPPILGNESRLGQVFLNLVVNAAQAIPVGHADRNLIRVSVRSEGDTVVAEVSDTGPGIPPEVMRRLFTPFVTTKPVGVGTGLGLSICHRIVTELGGEIGVQTEPGKGTTFTVVLPVTRTPAHEPDEPEPLPAESGRRRRVMVIDDEPLVAKAVARALSSHEVTVCGSGREALERLLAGARFDVILCDVMMPEMTGIDFYAAVAEAAPEEVKRVVFLTGGAFSEKAQQFLERCPNRTLEKPFDPARLRAVLDEIPD